MAAGYLRYPDIRGDLLTFVAGDDVWLAPASGGRAWRLSADDVPVSYPRFSRDGSQVAWTSRRDGNPEVYAADAGGSTANRLTYWGDSETRVTGWTAAGEVLALSAAGQPAEKYRRAYAVPGDGATPPRLLPFGAVTDVAIEDAGTVLLTGSVAGDGAIHGLSWSPDSAWLAWAQPEIRSLARIRIARVGSQHREIVDVTDGRFADSSPVFTHDGLYLAFLSRRSFDPVYDAHTFDLSFPLGGRPYLVPLAADTPSPFGPTPGGRPLGQEDDEQSAPPAVTVDPGGLARRVVALPVEEARYRSLRPVKGGLAWLRAPVSGVLGEGGADPDDDWPRPALQRFDLRKREVRELAGTLDWFRVSGDGTRIVISDEDELRVIPSARKPGDEGETVTVDQARARFQADQDALWRHAYGEAGRCLRRDFWTPDMSGVDWDGVLDAYRPLLDRIRGAADFADLLVEVAGELGTSHAYVSTAWTSLRDHTPAGQLGADISRDAAGRWLVDRVLPGESSDPWARSPLEAPGVAVGPGDELVAVDGQPVDPRRGPWPLLAGTAGKPVELTVLARGDDPPQTPPDHGGAARPPIPPRGPQGARTSRRVVVVPLHSDRRLRYQDWVAGRRRLVRELGGGRLGYLHIPDMMGEGWAHFHRDLRTEMTRDGLIFDVRGNSGGHTSELVVEKLARQVVGWCLARWIRPVSYPEEARRGPLVTVADEFAGSDGDIVTAAVKLLGLGPVVGTRTWGGVIGIGGPQGLVDGSSVTVPRYAFYFDEYGWGVENYGVDPDVEVLITPDDAAAGRDTQLETAVQLALEALDKQPLPALPRVAAGPGKARRPLPPRPGSLAASDAGAR